MRQWGRDVTAAAGFAGLLVGGALLFVLPVARTNSTLTEEISALEAELAEPIGGPEKVAVLQNDLDALKEFGQSRMTPIPEESDVAGFVRQVSASLSDLGLDQNELTTGQPDQLEEASSMPVILHLEGRFPQVYEAVRYIENLPRLVRVKRLHMKTRAARTELGTDEGVEADLTLDVFFNPSDIREPDVNGDGRSA